MPCGRLLGSRRLPGIESDESLIDIRRGGLKRLLIVLVNFYDSV